MDKRSIQRRLAAILAADVAGYTRLMEEDTDGTIAAWQAARDEVLEPTSTRYGGRVVKFTGDGFLVEFPTVQDAVGSAIAMQVALRSSPLEFRMGINLGDIVDDGRDIYGEGVNVAARLEGIADPGGICISGGVYDQVRNRIAVTYEDRGEQEVKNVSAPVRVYALANYADKSPEATVTAIMRRPAVAVLPFANMSGDTEQEYFADGLTEDIITALAACRQFPVIARNTTFTYKGRAVDVQAISKDLGVRYVLEGSVRKAGARLRVTGQLIDAETGHHVWAERYDRDLADVFEIQDELTRHIVATLIPTVERAELDRATAKHSDDLDAWDCYLRGVALLNEMSNETNPAAIEMFEQAIALDAGYAKAHARLALALARSLRTGGPADPEALGARMLDAARRAIRLDAADPLSHWINSVALTHVGRHEEAIREARTALDLNPADVDTTLTMGTSLLLSGRAEEAIPHLETAIRLSPRDARLGMFQQALALANLGSRRYEAAAEAARDALFNAEATGIAQAYRGMAALVLLSSLGHLERRAEAEKVMATVRPELLKTETAHVLFRRFQDQLFEGLRKAGLPGV